MSEQTEPIRPDSAPPVAASTDAHQPPTPAAPTQASPARRSVTLPLLPLAIVGSVIVALLFFGGGIAIGYGVAAHDARPDNAQQFRGGPGFGNGKGFGNGFGPRDGHPGQNGQNGQNQRPGDRPTGAPNNG